MNRTVFFVALLCSLVVTEVQAATLYIDPGVATVNRGDSITAAVRIMPDRETGECINAIDAVLTYSDNIQPVDVSLGESIFNVWLEKPKINKETHTITFAGGIPNGYCGRVEGDPRLTNIIAEIIFRSPGLQVGGSDEPEARIEFAPETQVLLNDGAGTRAPLVTLPATYTLSKDPGAVLQDSWRESVREDTLPPEEFSIELVNDPITYGGDYYIVFGTTDKQTGLSHYEVMEEPVLEFSQFKWGATGVPWERVETNQYLLSDQTLNSIIRVKAVDKAGNEYIATFIPDESKQTLSRNALYTYILMGVVGFGLLTLFFVLLLIYLKKRRIKKEELGLISEEEVN